MKTFFQKIFGQKGEINYLYFSCFLIFLSILSLSHFFTWEHAQKGISLFFLFYAIGQALLEVVFFVLIAYILNRWAPRWIYLSFIGISFVLMLLHFTHFIMVRLMDAPLIYIFKFLFGSGIYHLIAGFQALNMNWTMIAIIVGTFLFIPLAGLGFYWLTYMITKRKPLVVSLTQIALAIGIIGTSLFILDLIAHPFLNRRVYTKYQKTLPLGTTFLEPTLKHISLPTPLPPFRDEEATIRLMPQSPHLSHLPNIYLFVIETFRRDYLDAAPNLTNFGQENIQFKHSFANANSTHLSWFAIFHSDLPLYWASMRDNWTRGSIPLQMLKKMGYQISVYSAADLRFFNMDKIIFGSQRELGNKIEEYCFHRTLEPCDRDALAIEALETHLAPNGHVYLIFLDSTHSEYSFPKNFPLKYEPISKEIDYLTIGPKSPELKLIQNRYRNAIAYIDQLMGHFFDTLKEKQLYDDAIIAITGDHGEEFFEEGALFHGTHLNDFQTSVPFFLKFPAKEWVPQTDEATHIDIFPSILHYLTKESHFTQLFDGRSVFSLDRLPFRMAVLQNGPDTPLEFLLEKPDLKLQARFVDPAKLEIIELQGFLEPDILLPLSKNR
jgi:glucan phosphoethanolaminetransferase (alkaline phosphatase superfamily)